MKNTEVNLFFSELLQHRSLFLKNFRIFLQANKILGQFRDFQDPYEPCRIEQPIASKIYGNYFPKLKSLEYSECWPKLYKTLLNWKLLIPTHLFMKIVKVSIFLGRRYAGSQIFLGAKFSMNPYFWVSIEPFIGIPPYTGIASTLPPEVTNLKTS